LFNFKIRFGAPTRGVIFESLLAPSECCAVRQIYWH